MKKKILIKASGITAPSWRGYNLSLIHIFKGNIIVEEFIEKQGCSSDSDSFSVNGVLQFVSFSAQRFDENAAGTFVPVSYTHLK